MRKSVIFFFVLLIALFVLVYKFNVLSVKNIVIQKDNIDCVDDSKLISDLKIDHKTIFFVDLGPVSSWILANYACVRDVKVSKRLPQEMDIVLRGRIQRFNVGTYQKMSSLDLKEASPSSAAALLNWEIPSESMFYGADEEGVVFAQAKEFLPTVFIPDTEVHINSRLEKDVFEKLFLIVEKIKESKGLESYNVNDLQTAKAKIDGDNLLILWKPRLVFSLQQDIFRQLGSLQLIFQKAKIDEKTIETIDLRFQKAVITFSPKNGESK